MAKAHLCLKVFKTMWIKKERKNSPMYMKSFMKIVAQNRLSCLCVSDYANNSSILCSRPWWISSIPTNLASQCSRGDCLTLPFWRMACPNEVHDVLFSKARVVLNNNVKRLWFKINPFLERKDTLKGFSQPEQLSKFVKLLQSSVGCEQYFSDELTTFQDVTVG